MAFSLTLNIHFGNGMLEFPGAIINNSLKNLVNMFANFSLEKMFILASLICMLTGCFKSVSYDYLKMFM